MFRRHFIIALTLACAGPAYISGSAIAGYVTTTPSSPDPHMIQTSGPVVYANGVMMDHLAIDLQAGAPTLNLKGLAAGTTYSADSFFDVFTELSFDSGQTWKSYSGSTPGTMIITPQSSGGDLTHLLYDSEIVLPHIRLSLGSPPHLDDPDELALLLSKGGITVTQSAGNSGPATYHTESFFDVFTELSFDAGQTWTPAGTPAHLEAVPEPGTLSLAAGACGWLVAAAARELSIHSRRRKPKLAPNANK